MTYSRLFQVHFFRLSAKKTLKFHRLLLIVCTLIIACGTLLRLAGMSTELWFDEIHSINYVQSAHSPLLALFSIHSDNKHHLTWLWIWLAGPGRAAWVYRAPSLLAGITLLPLLFRVIRQEAGMLAAVVALLITTFCYPLIFYCSEARGYSIATLLAVFAYSLSPDALRTESVSRAVLFSMTVVFGFLAHLTFIYIYAGLVVWAVMDAMRKPRLILLLYHLPAAMALAVIYFLDVSKIRYGGGPPTTAIQVLLWTISWTFETPTDGFVPWITGAGILVCSIFGLVLVARRSGLVRGAFFLTAVIIAPIVLTATRRNPYLATRYYLVCIPFIIMLVSIGLAATFKSLSGKLAAAILLVVMIVSSISSTRQLRLLGRGHVRECLNHICSETPSDPVTVNTERPLMDDECISYYGRGLPDKQQVIIAGSQPAKWWILDLDTPFAVGSPAIHRHGADYKLDSIYPSDPTSGLTWDLYKRTGEIK